MPRKYGRKDGNQSKIEKGLRQLGCTVNDMSSMGDGFPDMCVGRNGVNYLFEVKDPEHPPSKRKLTDDQVEWHAGWRGQKAVIETLDDAIKIIFKK